MRTLAILPVKRFDAAKQRLSSELPDGARQAIVLAMFSDVLVALGHVERLDEVVVVSSDPLAQARARAERVDALADDQQAGQSAAVRIGIERALAEGFDRVLLVPGDTPMLDPHEVDELLGRGQREGLQALIVPDRHGTGTNALAISPPDALAPSFGSGSCERHVTAAMQSGLAHRVERVESLAHDVDTAEDLAALRSLLEERRRLASMTRGALFQLDRSRTSERAEPAAIASSPHSADASPPAPASGAAET